MAITLAALPAGSLWKQALVLAVVAMGITAAVYGVVALIVKADDVGLALASKRRRRRSAARSDAASFAGMPCPLKCLSVVGTAAMIWVGGGIVLHGLEVYGPPAIQHAVHAAEEAASRIFPPAAGLLTWIAEAVISGVVGFVVGAATIPFASFVLAPAWARAKGFRKG